MSVQPKGEKLRKAVKWVSDKRKYEQVGNIKQLIEKACLKFNLSPKDAEFLFRTLLDAETTEG